MAAIVTNQLISPRFLFRFSVPVRHSGMTWKQGGVELEEPHKLLNLATLDAGTNDREPLFADVRLAWNVLGLTLNVRVDGKQQAPWCRDGRLEDSDGVQVWIDTRATLNVHRASRYCHRFVFVPVGAGQRQAEPVADQLLINRARENARPIRPRELQVASRVSKTGYWLSAFMPAQALVGYDPVQYRQLGFTYAVFDRELGLQTFASGPALPFTEDPTCWAALELVDAHN